MFKRFVLTAVVAIPAVYVGTIIKNTNYVSEYLANRRIQQSVKKYESICKKQAIDKQNEEKQINYFKQNADKLFTKGIFDKLSSEINSGLIGGKTMGNVYYCCNDKDKYMFASANEIYTYHPQVQPTYSERRILKYNGILKRNESQLHHEKIIKSLQEQFAKYGMRITINHVAHGSDNVSITDNRTYDTHNVFDHYEYYITQYGLKN